MLAGLLNLWLDSLLPLHLGDGNYLKRGFTLTDTCPYFKPLVDACQEHGICRTVAFDLSRRGLLSTFSIGKRRYVHMDSLRTLPERLAAMGVNE